MLQALSLSINIFAAVGDVLIAAILCTILQSSKTGFERSNLLINKLVRGPRVRVVSQLTSSTDGFRRQHRPVD